MSSLSVLSVSGAATAWVHDRLAQPPRQARVLHRGRDAVYVDDRGECLALLSRAAVAVPCGVRTLLDDLDDALPASIGPASIGRPLAAGPGSGDVAMLGGGRFVLGGLEVSVLRMFDACIASASAAVGIDADPGEATRAGVADALPDTLMASAEVPREALDRLSASDPGAVIALLGRGSGLTPFGDDVLCGWLATRVARRLPVDPIAEEVLAWAPLRTTLLSATLLRCALRGEVIPEFREVLCGRSGVDALLAVGHTSGTGLALGMKLALDPVPPRPRVEAGVLVGRG